MDCDVAIIGAGPVGLTLANLLARRGVSVAVFERHAAPYPYPRAVHFDGETMRVFQSAGLAKAVLPHTRVARGMLFKSPGGEVLVDWSRAQEIGPQGWHESYRFFQPGLEEVLRHGLARFDHAALTVGQSASVTDQSDTDVTLDLADGRKVTARYVVACDGAASPTRAALGIEHDDLGFQERWLVTDLRLTTERPDLGEHSVQYCDPNAPSTYVYSPGPWRRWEMRLGPDAPDHFTSEEVWPRLARWITQDEATLERAAVYTFRSRIAATWQAGRVFLAGDAAHQMPPFMGQGMCAGIRDAANLAWKLKAVLNGYDPALLRTYQTEREANVRVFIERSAALGRLINQTAAGQIPKGRMRSLWPDLGSGLGAGDAVGGKLLGQARLPNGTLADDAAGHGFYILGTPTAATTLPIIGPDAHTSKPLAGAAAVIRPDGYALGAATTDTIAQAETLARALALR